MKQKINILYKLKYRWYETRIYNPCRLKLSLLQWNASTYKNKTAYSFAYRDEKEYIHYGKYLTPITKYDNED